MYGTTKNAGSALACAAALLAGMVIGCADFPTMYDRVDEDMIRVLDFMYDPAEAAPGDSVTLTAVFAGKRFDLDEIEWRVSYAILANNYGVNAGINETLLDYAAEPVSFSPTTQALKLRFKIPETVIADNPIIPDDWDAGALGADSLNLPENIELPSKKELTAILDAAARKADSWKVALAKSDNARDSLLTHDGEYALYEAVAPLLPALLQVLSAPIRLFADLPQTHVVQSDYTVRYNHVFAGLPAADIHVNRNPVIDSIVVYDVEKPGLAWFEPEKTQHKYTSTVLYRAGDRRDGEIDAAISVDKGRSYFIAGYTSPPDSVYTIDSISAGGGPLVEFYSSQWYFQLDEKEIEEVETNKYLNIVNLDQLLALIMPAGDRRVRTTTVWLEVRDDMLNEAFHPVASTLEEARIRFAYTNAYIKSLDERQLP